MDRMKIAATARASFAIYNTREEVDFLIDSLKRVIGAESAKAARHVAPAQELGLLFPEAVADSPAAAEQQLIETFDLLDDWENRHQYLVEQGDKLLPMAKEMKTESNRVRGCMSTVHLFARKRAGTVDTLDFLADSDAAIVRGLIWLLEQTFAGQSAKAVLAFDIESLLKRLGLDQHLSMGRRNGLAGMIQRIRGEAAKIAQKD
jgi:cysteine desulfurase/selenocysteine lyase